MKQERYVNSIDVSSHLILVHFVFLLLPHVSLFLSRLVWCFFYVFGWRLLVSVSWGKCSSLLRDSKQINTHYNLITSPPQHTHTHTHIHIHTQQQIINLIWANDLCVCVSLFLSSSLHLNYWSVFLSFSLLKWTPYPMIPPKRSLKAE